MKRIFIDILAVLTIGFIFREFWPKVEKDVVTIPRIVTVHDTLHDTLNVVGPGVIVTTDTLNLVTEQVIHDTVSINNSCDQVLRTNVWPILGFNFEKANGKNELSVTTFSLKTTRGASSKLYPTGPLLGMWADSTPTPRVSFGELTKPTLPLLQKLKWSGLGAAAVVTLRFVFGK